MHKLKKIGIYFTVFFITFIGVYFSYSKYADIKQVEYKYNTVESKRELTSDLSSNSEETATPTSTAEPEPEVTKWVESHEPVRAEASSDKYEIKVVKSEQKTYIYKNDELFKKFVCSTGLESEGYITKTGIYNINSYYGKSFYNPKYKSGAKYWVGFIGSIYLFHSVPTDVNGDIIEDEAKKLGSQASHGCIRFSEEEAFWFYENIPIGTKVNIVD